ELVDVEGEDVVNGGTYYMLPGIEGDGGGMEGAKTGRETCPITVVQSRNDVSNGEPITIESPFRSYFIPKGSLVRIGFTSPPKCAPSPWWTLALDRPQGLSVKLGEYESTEFNYSFKFEDVSSKLHSYKLSYCVREEWYEDYICKNIGIYRDSKGYRRLVVNEENPLVVVLKKVESS
uniref:Trypsin inhibitor 1B n=1 Tax=Erythrina variegata TaxID=3845 RepID=IT1B_ERYVA|nr:RecName: Full=Trypsin inhibitor 1B; AltName: Full=ETIB [Erythrina variegata]AAB24755.1 ETIb=Kunitz-type trypsin inhibitor [Erythrina variegata, var. Orientalis, seeds, Peptide, 176 aa] [Erythrina variegata]prf//1903155B trypsin inhibitor ET1b [Erythrina variegata var. orientalis]